MMYSQYLIFFCAQDKKVIRYFCLFFFFDTFQVNGNNVLVFYFKWLFRERINGKSRMRDFIFALEVLDLNRFVFYCSATLCR